MNKITTPLTAILAFSLSFAQQTPQLNKKYQRGGKSNDSR